MDIEELLALLHLLLSQELSETEVDYCGDCWLVSIYTHRQRLNENMNVSEQLNSTSSEIPDLNLKVNISVATTLGLSMQIKQHIKMCY